MWIHWPFFPKTWTKGHWPLDDLWPHVCWGHMCDSTQGSLCPSPMTIHQCMWIQWSILQITTYIHTHTTCILHTTYRMSDHIVSYWTQFRRDNKRMIIQIFDESGITEPMLINFWVKHHHLSHHNACDENMQDENQFGIPIIKKIIQDKMYLSMMTKQNLKWALNSHFQIYLYTDKKQKYDVTGLNLRDPCGIQFPTISQ